MMYNVVIHYQGALDFEVNAESEEEAKEWASQQFEEFDVGDLTGIDWKIDDCWKIK